MKRTMVVVSCVVMAGLIVGCGTAPAAPSVSNAPASTASGSAAASASAAASTPTAAVTSTATGTLETQEPTASASPVEPTAPPEGGLIWSRVEDVPGSENSSPYTAAALDGALVVLGGHYGGPDLEPYLGPAAWYSGDGVGWSETSLPGAPTARVHTVAVLGGNLFALGSWVESSGDPFVWTSSDGQTWAAVGSPPDGKRLRGLTQTGTGLAATGEDRQGAVTLWQSADGTSWQPSTITDSGLAGKIAVSDSGVFLVVAEFENALWRSEDGVTWDSVSLPTTDEVVDALIARGDGFLLATDDFGDGTVWSSDDGFDWVEVLSGGNAAFGNSTFAIGVGGSGYLAINGEGLWTSPDGVTWSEGDHSAFVPTPNATRINFQTITATGDGGALVAGYEYDGRPDSTADGNLVLWVGRPAP